MAAASNFTVHQPTLFKDMKVAKTFSERYGAGYLKAFKCLHGAYVAIVDDEEVLDFIRKTDEVRHWAPSNIFMCSWKEIDSYEYPGDDVEYIELWNLTTRTGKVDPTSQPPKFREKFGTFFGKDATFIRVERASESVAGRKTKRAIA